MPWYNGNFPPSYKNQPIPLLEKAVEIANQLLDQGTDEGIAIATGLNRARLFFKIQIPMPTDKKYVEAFHDYDDFMMKKRQYAKAVHVFHDQTADYNENHRQSSCKNTGKRGKKSFCIIAEARSTIRLQSAKLQS